MTPPCFPDHETWKAWVRLARLEPPGRAGHCTDCSPTYQAQMIEQGRCERPDIVWWLVDGQYEGHLPPKRKKSEREVLTAAIVRA